MIGRSVKGTPGRVTVTGDAQTRDFLPKVQVKVIGSDNPQFISGETDLRGVFVAEGPNGVITAVARKGTNQYAFYRGTRSSRQPAAEAPNAAAARRRRRPGQARPGAPTRPSTPTS